MTEFTVEIADLRGWSTQVGRSGTHLFEAHNFSARTINDANFGRIMDLLKGDYEKMVPAIHDVLLASTENMDKARRALATSAEEYVNADRNFAKSFADLDAGIKVTVIDDGVANGFDDKSGPTAHLKDPSSRAKEIPTVTYGPLWDRVCDVLVFLGTPDPRLEVVRLISGDTMKASRQADAWRMLAELIDDVDENLKIGQGSISKTWKGNAANSASAHFGAWKTKFENQESVMRKVAKALDDAAEQAVEMAQNVADALVLIVSILTAALFKVSIPLVGQAYLAKKGWEAVKLLRHVRTTMNVFFTLLRSIVNLFKTGISEFSRESLPKPPQV
ncbi:WXG100 family type VII secretion target [Nocardia fluminea]|uniref:WXG100 family type VII secretion target n=1 Tax=Nocardia fluminea TaxID=134984 RepID=UPI00366AE5C1